MCFLFYSFSLARAYAILSTVYAWLDNSKLFAKNLDTAKKLVQMMQENGEELPLVRKRRRGERDGRATENRKHEKLIFIMHKITLKKNTTQRESLFLYY